MPNRLNFLLVLLTVHLVTSDLIVQTDNGPVQGIPVSSGKIEAFLGIPYAEPPVGALRFAKPVRKSHWVDVYDATHLPPPCIQPNLVNIIYAPDTANMSEDCLYLNVWVPRLGRGDELKPIMFFIHGGGFFVGSSEMKLYDGARMAEYGDVVVVTVNYRLGCLGFFTGFTDEAPGNLGFYDQVMALQWIKKNAKHFHGDSDLITLFGESSGAFSVSMHQISPLSKNLFKRAILQSGSAVNPLYSDDNEQLYKICSYYAELLGCANSRVTLKTNPAEVVDCLKRVPARNVSVADMEVREKYKLLYPRIGNGFLPMNTIDAYRHGQFKDSEVLMGITRDEGSLFLPGHKPELFDKIGEIGISQIFNETTAYLTIKGIFIDDDPSMDDDIIRSYLDKVNESTGYNYVTAVNEAAGDGIVTCGNIFQAEYQLLREDPVYFYVFDHRPSSTPFPEWMGVAHFEEVQFVFGNPMYKVFTEFEKELSRDIISMWATFAKTGNPNIPGGMHWPKYTYQDRKYYIIGKHDRIGMRPDSNRCDSWRKRFRSFIDDDVIQTLKKSKLSA